MKHWKKLAVAASLAGAMMCGFNAYAADYDLDGYTQEEFDALERTTVLKSDESPTGYYVTFRYKDPDAGRVRIYGEWKFSDIYHSTFVTSQNLMPDDWSDGDVEWQTDGWPTAEMELNEDTGVWSYTIPLPTGTFNYRFLVGGADGAAVDDATDAQLVADPANTNFLAPDEDTENLGGEQALTSVYVPWDGEKQANTDQRPEEMPRDTENGTVSFETATTEDGIATSYGVYLPNGYDADREEAYPLLVLFHGGGGYDGSWFSNGLANILDNMIAEGRMEPTIVVTPNGSDFPNDNFMWDRESICQFVINDILPHMTENYNASDDPSRRAFAGLSQGGATVGYMMFTYPEAFDTYAFLSAPYMGDTNLDFTIPELKDKTIFFGYGDYDFVQTRSLYKLYPDADGNMVRLASREEGSIWEYMYGLAEADVDFTSINYAYGHQWALWRKLMVNICEDILWK